jgi:uncharacterized protein YndB with AHSA1/START domain
MIERVLILPVSQDDLWEAITNPAEVSEWFGAQVDWDLSPGGKVHTRDDSGAEREGRIDAVETGRFLRFNWWPTDDRSQESEVTYELEPNDEGSLLTVTERSVAATALRKLPTACISTAFATGDPMSTADHRWTSWDDALVSLFARTCRHACWC